MSSKEMTNVEEQVKSLYKVMQDEKVEVLDIKSQDMKLYIRRKNPNAPVQQAKNIRLSNDTKVEENVNKNVQQEQQNTLKSPITGVFYRSASPSMPMFVNEGDVADVNKTLCIIEAMKVMNEIKATEKIKIIKILVENGTSVVSGQDLFVIEKL